MNEEVWNNSELKNWLWSLYASYISMGLWFMGYIDLHLCILLIYVCCDIWDIDYRIILFDDTVYFLFLNIAISHIQVSMNFRHHVQLFV